MKRSLVFMAMLSGISFSAHAENVVELPASLSPGIQTSHTIVTTPKTVNKPLGLMAKQANFGEGLYTPPTLPVDAKSLRMVNQQSAITLPAKQWEMYIQHRFGALSSGAYNWYGIDQSFMRIGLDYGLNKNTTLGISRSSMGKIADLSVKYQFLGSKKKESSWKGAYYLNMTSDIRKKSDFTDQQPMYYSNRLRFVNQVIITKSFGDKFVLGLVPTWVHVNLVDKNVNSNDIPVLASFARVKFNERYCLTAEMASPVNLPVVPLLNPRTANTSVNVPANPYMAIGLDIFTAKHVFHLSFSNAQSMNESYLYVTDNGSFKQTLRFGFNIVRRW